MIPIWFFPNKHHQLIHSHQNTCVRSMSENQINDSYCAMDVKMFFEKIKEWKLKNCRNSESTEMSNI